MFFTLQASPFYDRGIFEDPIYPNGVYFIRGKWLNWQPDKPLLYRSNCDREHPPRPAMGGAVPVWSPALLDAISATGVKNIQAFPAAIEADGEGFRWDNYLAINVVGMVSVADLNTSKFEKMQEQSGGLSLFRLAENRLELVVHKHIIDRLSESSPPGGWGLLVRELEHYSKSPFPERT